MSYQEEGQGRLRRLRTKQAIVLAMQSRWKEAVAINKGIIESFPQDIDAYNRLGRAFMELGEYSLAKEAYGRALELDPYNAIAQKNLRRLTVLGERPDSSEGDSHVAKPQHFIEEIGKAGVINLTRSLAGEWAKHNINVNAIAPGMIETEGVRAQQILTTKAAEETPPLERPGQPEDVAYLAIFLASEASNHISGETIPVRGVARA